MLLVITSLKKIFFHFMSPFMKIFFLQTNSSERERLAVRNGGLAMERVATIHAEILMFVRGFSVEVCTDLAILKEYRCVQKCYLFSSLGGSKFDGGVVTIKALNKAT